jgi:hypothetical protein
LQKLAKIMPNLENMPNGEEFSQNYAKLENYAKPKILQPTRKNSQICEIWLKNMPVG